MQLFILCFYVTLASMAIQIQSRGLPDEDVAVKDSKHQGYHIFLSDAYCVVTDNIIKDLKPFLLPQYVDEDGLFWNDRICTPDDEAYIAENLPIHIFHTRRPESINNETSNVQKCWAQKGYIKCLFYIDFTTNRTKIHPDENGVTQDAYQTDPNLWVYICGGGAVAILILIVLVKTYCIVLNHQKDVKTIKLCSIKSRPPMPLPHEMPSSGQKGFPVNTMPQRYFSEQESGKKIPESSKNVCLTSPGVRPNVLPRKPGIITSEASRILSKEQNPHIYTEIDEQSNSSDDEWTFKKLPSKTNHLK